MALTQANEQGPLYPVIVSSQVLLTGQTAAIGSTSLGTFPAGLYRISISITINTVGTSGTLAGNVIYTDDSQAQTIAVCTVAAISAKTLPTSNMLVIENTASAAINYSTTFSGTPGSVSYSLYIILERLL